MKFTRFLELLEIHSINPDNIVLSSDFMFNDSESNTNYELLFEDGSINKLENTKDENADISLIEFQIYKEMDEFVNKSSRTRRRTYNTITEQEPDIAPEQNESLEEIYPTIEDLPHITPPSDPNGLAQTSDHYEYYNYEWKVVSLNTPNVYTKHE